MRFSLAPELTQAWPQLLASARRADADGWSCLWLADHLMADEDRNPELPILECWTTAAALLAHTRRIAVGTLVSATTFRHPGVVAKMAATLQIQSGERFRLGLGAGGQENEHAALGIPFASLRERAGALEEAAIVVRSLLEDPATTFSGRHHALEGARLYPRPARRTELLLGGASRRWTLPVVARRADAWSIWGTPAELRRVGAALDACCVAEGRDPRQVAHGAQAGLLLSDDPQLLLRARTARALPASIIGTGEGVAEVVAEYADAGVRELIISDFPLISQELVEESLGRFIAEVAPRFGAAA